MESKITNLSNTIKVGVAVNCLVCGEPVGIADIYTSNHIRICDKCKEAVMHVRKQLEIDIKEDE